MKHNFLRRIISSALCLFTLTEFNSNNTRRLNLEETKAKIASLSYIQERLAEGK